MGWQSDDGRHEGYIAGLVAFQAGGRRYLRDLGPGVDEGLFDAKAKATPRGSEMSLDAIQVVCTCGWRSQCFRAPPGAYFTQWIVLGISDAQRDMAEDLWEGHLHAPRPAGWTPYESEDWWLSIGRAPR